MTQIANPRTKFDFVSDPGHGWLLVTAGELARAGLKETDITPYSYRHPTDELLALEEDVDAMTFVKAWEGLIGQRIEICEANPVPIRSWPSFGRKSSQ